MPTYGGGPNPPVRLDPWQNIVEVGWPGDYVALQVAMGHSEASINAGSGMVCSGGLPGEPDGRTSTHVTKHGFAYRTNGVPVSSTNKWSKASQSWSFVELDVTGMPELGGLAGGWSGDLGVEFSYNEVTSGAPPFGATIDPSFSASENCYSVFEQAGDDLGIPIPAGLGAANFLSGPTRIIVKGHHKIGDYECFASGGSYSLVNVAVEELASFNFPFDGIIAHEGPKAYRPIGAQIHVASMSSPTGGQAMGWPETPSGQGQYLHILCKRSPADDLT